MENWSQSFSSLAVEAATDPGSFLDVDWIQVQISVQHMPLHHSAMLNGEVVHVQIDVVTEAAFRFA